MADSFLGIFDSFSDTVSGLFDIVGAATKSNSSKYDKAMQSSSSNDVPLTMGQIRTATSGKSTQSRAAEAANYDRIYSDWVQRMYTFGNFDKMTSFTQVQGPNASK